MVLKYELYDGMKGDAAVFIVSIDGLDDANDTPSTLFNRAARGEDRPRAMCVTHGLKLKDEFVVCFDDDACFGHSVEGDNGHFRGYWGYIYSEQ